MLTKTSTQISKSTAYGYLMTNLLVLPGLGSLMAGRKGEGIAQMVLSVLGVVVTTFGLAGFLFRVYQMMQSKSSELPFDAFFYIGVLGFLLFLCGWGWSLWTGYQLVRSSDSE